MILILMRRKQPSKKPFLRLLKSVFYFSVNSLDFGFHPLLNHRQLYISEKLSRLLLPIRWVVLPVWLVAHTGETVPSFRAGEVGKDGIGFGAGHARVSGVLEQEVARVNLGGVVLGIGAIGPETVLHAAPEH